VLASTVVVLVEVKTLMTKNNLALIGAVTVHFTALEDWIAFMIGWQLVGNETGNEPIGRIVTAELSVRQKIDLLGSLLRQKFPDRNNSDFEQLKKDILKVVRNRNKVVHSLWIENDRNQLLRIKHTARGQLRTESLPVRPQELQAITVSIDELLGAPVEFSCGTYRSRVRGSGGRQG
jgi:hypothetical protein